MTRMSQPSRKISLTGIQSTGDPHLGNLVGAIRPALKLAESYETMYFIADFHAVNAVRDPQQLQHNIRSVAATWLAAGLDPSRTIFYRQSAVPEIFELNWVLSCVTGKGLLNRAHAYKAARDRNIEAGKDPDDGVNMGLFNYPVLMAADILLHGADEVPVGADQAQHLELARTLARRFNTTYGEVFTVPRGVLPRVAARVRDLADPGRKMEKSAGNGPGVVYVLDPPEVIRRKVRRAVTDTEGEVRYDPERQPGVANLLEILAACTDVSPYTAAATVDSYAALKEAVADAVIEELRPVRERTTTLLADPAELERVRKIGAERARERAVPRLEAALRVVGLR